jgi:cytochrome c553
VFMESGAVRGNDVGLPMRKIWKLLIGVIVAFPFAAHAQSIEEKAQICAACHGENGVPPQQEFPVPVIWGQQLGYLIFQLRDFKSGARKNEQMTPIAQTLDAGDLMPLAQYFSKKAWPNLQQPAATAAVATQAQRANVSIGCTGCHQEGYKGEGTQPRLAGQNRAYLEKTMTDFRSGARGNNPGMSDLMKATPEPDLAALATYLAGL